ncbi:hypothetical protein Tco_0912632 [Tanacetum coccineum]
MSAKDIIAVQRCGLSAKELNAFLSFYPIPSEYDIILPISTQTIFDAPPDSIISFKYPQLLLDENMLNLKSFKDKLPPNIDENPYFQHLGRYPTSVHVFDDPIMFLAGLKPSWEFGQQRPAIIMDDNEMAFRNFIYTKDDDELAFLPKEPSPGFGTGSPSALVNTELPKDVEEPKVQHVEIIADSGESPKASVFIVHPRSVVARIKERKCKTRGGSSRPPMKRKLASGSSSSHVVPAKTSASKDDAPILSISDDDEDANACHLKISAITPPAWKGHLDNQMDLELLDLHDRCYARQAMVDNAVKRRAREFLLVIEKMRGEADVIKARERSREKECEEFESNVKLLWMMLESQKWAGYQVTLSTLESKVDSLEAEKARLEAVEASLRREVEELKQDRRDVVSKVVPYAAMELVHCDELVRLVGTLVSSAITYGRCRAYEQVASMKEPFVLSKVKVYRSSYNKEHTQASNDFATATFLWLDEFVADAATPIEALLSKKPPTQHVFRCIVSGKRMRCEHLDVDDEGFSYGNISGKPLLLNGMEELIKCKEPATVQSVAEVNIRMVRVDRIEDTKGTCRVVQVMQQVYGALVKHEVRNAPYFTDNVHGKISHPQDYAVYDDVIQLLSFGIWDQAAQNIGWDGSLMAHELCEKDHWRQLD